MTEEEEFMSRADPVEEDLRLQRRVWRFERIGWVTLLIIVGLTLAGLFSKGPLSGMSGKPLMAVCILSISVSAVTVLRMM